VTDDALLGGLGGAFSGDVLAPGVSPLGAALVVAFQQVEKLIARLVGRLTGPHSSYELAPQEGWQHRTIHVEPQ
jgi:hypothetical protein